MKIKRKALKFILWLAVTAFVAVYLYKNLDQLLSYKYKLNIILIATSFCFASLAYLLNISIWVKIANHCGAHAHWIKHAHIWSSSRLGRYVPGKVAAIYLRIDGYANKRVSAGVSLYIEICASLIATCLFILIFSSSSLIHINGLHLTFIALTLTMLTILASKRILHRLASAIVQLERFDIPERMPRFRFWASVVFFQLAVMMLHGLSLYLSIRSLSYIHPIKTLEVTFFYYFAGLAGMLALFAPAGIGVREAVLTTLLQTVVPLPVAIVATVLVRCISVAAEISISGFFFLLSRLNPKLSLRQERGTNNS